MRKPAPPNKRGRWIRADFALSIVRGVNSVPPGSLGSSTNPPPPRLVRRLHVDLCRLASCLCLR
ncbi:putative leader peptide [Spirillospora sp. NPDC047279]|uniref:putative leader peptide n=1 Tax=Spirillospora sp. NPDC047279 TaxID=3155478 RepID=UPI0034018AA7